MNVADKRTIEGHPLVGRPSLGRSEPRLLVIDDEPLLGQTLRLGLEGSFSVELESRGDAALSRLLSGEKFDLILCDLSLPTLSGIDVYKRLHEALPDLIARFIFMTGGAVTDEARDFVAMYQGPILNKPFRLAELEALAARVLESHGLSGRRSGLG